MSWQVELGAYGTLGFRARQKMRELSTTHWVTVDLSSQWFTTRFRECQAKGLPYLSRQEASIKEVALPLQPTSEEEAEEEVWNERKAGLQRDTVY